MLEISPQELKEAMKVYVERYGKGQVTLEKLEKIVEELRNDK